MRVDVGVVCLWLGRVAERRCDRARELAAALIQRADKLMYDAKGERANHIYLERVRVVAGELADVTTDIIAEPLRRTDHRRPWPTCGRP